MANDYTSILNVPDFGTQMAAAAGAKTSFFLGQSFDREIRSLAFSADIDRAGLFMEWDLVQVATPYEAEALLATNKIEGMFTASPSIFYLKTGATLYHRPLRVDLTEKPTGEADTIKQFVITVQYEEMEPHIQSLGESRQNASVLMERGQSATNLRELERTTKERLDGV